MLLSNGTLLSSLPFVFAISPPKIIVLPSLTLTTVESFFSDVSGAITLSFPTLLCSSSLAYLKLLTDGFILKIISLSSEISGAA